VRKNEPVSRGVCFNPAKFAQNRLGGMDWRGNRFARSVSRVSPAFASADIPIRIGLTCWLWEWRRSRALERLAEQLGVTLRLEQRRRGLLRLIEGEVSGRNVDRFLTEFARHG
jgi:hypothetical protein